jgi:predicted transcriptional regulator
MGQITLSDEILRKLREIATRENKTEEAVLEEVLDKYVTDHQESTTSLEAMAGVFDDAIPDLSTTIRETMNSFYKNKK